MFDLESGNFLRIALAGGIIGFAVFCAFYSFTVWQRRNRAGATLLSTLSLLLIVTGVLGTAFFWLANNLTAREGIVEGSDLFVVRTKRDTSIHSLIDAEEVQEGTILAAYSRPGMENRIAVLDSRINEANARLLAVDVRSLPVDQTLLQRYWDLRSQIGQARSFRFELQRSQRDIEKDKLEALAARTREQEAAKMEAAIAQEAFKAATGRLRMAHAAAARADALRKRAIIPVQDIEARQGDVLVFKMEQETAQSKIALYKQRIISLQAHYAQYLKTLDQQTAAINQDIGSVDERLADLLTQFSQTEVLIAADRNRAEIYVQHDKEAAQYLLAALKAEKATALASAVIRAPHAGRVVYRHPSPDLAPEATPVLAISAHSGFSAIIRLPQNEVEQIKNPEFVVFAVDRPLMNRFFTGVLQSVERAPFDPRSVLARFRVQLPQEAATLLAVSQNSLPIQLRWQPNILSDVRFQISMAVLFLGLLGAAIGAARRGKQKDIREQQEIEAVAAAIGSTAGGKDQTPLRPRIVAAGFHSRLRSGELTTDTVRSVESIIDEFGDDAIEALRNEIRLDKELLDAVDRWNRDHPHYNLNHILEINYRSEAVQTATPSLAY